MYTWFEREEAVKLFTAYAPKSQVQNLKPKTISTKSPLGITLTQRQRRELLAFEGFFADLSAGNQDQLGFLFEQFEIHSTDNAGLHYFCLEHDLGVLHLAYNQNLSKDVYMLLFEKAMLITDLLRASNVYFTLLDNRSVIRNPTLFTLTFEALRKMDPNFDIFKLLTRKALSEVNIDIFMSILVEAGCSKYDTAKIRFARAALSREAEILEWVSRTSPEFKDLPLSWFLRAHGIPSL